MLVFPTVETCGPEGTIKIFQPSNVHLSRDVNVILVAPSQARQLANRILEEVGVSELHTEWKGSFRERFQRYRDQLYYRLCDSADVADSEITMSIADWISLANWIHKNVAGKEPISPPQQEPLRETAEDAEDCPESLRNRLERLVRLEKVLVERNEALDRLVDRCRKITEELQEVSLQNERLSVERDQLKAECEQLRKEKAERQAFLDSEKLLQEKDIDWQEALALRILANRYLSQKTAQTKETLHDEL